MSYAYLSMCFPHSVTKTDLTNEKSRLSSSNLVEDFHSGDSYFRTYVSLTNGGRAYLRILKQATAFHLQ